jgi:hypothetical protein
VRNPIGSEHAPWVDADGCTIMVKLLQMADTGEGTTPFHVNLDTAKTDNSIDVSYGRVSELYRNDSTGEVVEMCWVNADQTFATDAKASKGGEEMFIMNGSICLSDEEFGRWDWLRFPVGSIKERPKLIAGPSGAQVYRKTGHLTDKPLSMERIRIGDDETVIAD